MLGGKSHAMRTTRPETPSSRLIILLLTVTVLAVLAAGASLTLFATSRPPGGDSLEVGFARDMMVHHAQAVQMAEIVRERTHNEAIRVLAKEIALNQRAEIGHIQGWLAAWGVTGTHAGPAMDWMGHPSEDGMPGMATPEELNRLMEAPPEEADTLFLLLMIPHHRGAMLMTGAILDRTDRPEVRRLANFMAASQRQEIELMRSMLREGEMAPVKVPLKAADARKASGTATFAGTERGLEVGLELRNLPEPDAAYLAHIHPGYCGAPNSEVNGHEGAGEIDHPLSPVESDGSGDGSSKTTLEGTTLDELFSGKPAHINVHAAGSGVPQQLACADLSVADSITAYDESPG
jgi:uncharacterized protein (DUF305 family)